MQDKKGVKRRGGDNEKWKNRELLMTARLNRPKNSPPIHLFTGSAEGKLMWHWLRLPRQPCGREAPREMQITASPLPPRECWFKSQGASGLLWDFWKCKSQSIFAEGGRERSPEDPPRLTWKMGRVNRRRIEIIIQVGPCQDGLFHKPCQRRVHNEFVSPPPANTQGVRADFASILGKRKGQKVSL